MKAYKTSKTKGYFPYEWFNDPEKLNNIQLPPYGTFFSKLRNNNPLEKVSSDFHRLIDGGLTSKEALLKLKFEATACNWTRKLSRLGQCVATRNMRTIEDFLCWYNNNDVVPTLEDMQKMVDFYHNKGIDMLKLGCTLPNLANICLHKSTTAKFYPFTESDKDLPEKIHESMVGGPSIVFTRKAVLDETFIQDSTNLCKNFVGIDASQLYPFSMCQAMPTGLYTRWELDLESGNFKPRQNKMRSFENMVL